MPLQIDIASRRVSLDPRDPFFYGDPYRAYREIQAVTPVFFWEQYGFWCFARHADVSALLRDRRFGRQILHVASRRELGWDEPGAHLKPFFDLERHSLLELEPPEHSRLRNLVNRAFVSRQVERLAPRIAALTNDLIDGFKSRGSAQWIPQFANSTTRILLLGFSKSESLRGVVPDWHGDSGMRVLRGFERSQFAERQGSEKPRREGSLKPMSISRGSNFATIVFEPIGGSAPKYTGQSVINPLAAICAGQMMLDFLGETAAAQAIETAVVKVTREKIKSLAAGKMGYTTSQVGDLVASAL